MRILLVFISFTFIALSCNEAKMTNSNLGKFAIVIHGGAGQMDTSLINKELQNSYISALDTALKLGLNALQDGKSSIEAVTTVIVYMEDNPLFNAGRGAVFNHAGKNELDASIMSGSDLTTGAVAGVTDVKNPILLALRIKEKSEHVMLSGNGASEFAREQGLETADSTWFYTEKSHKSLERAIEHEKSKIISLESKEIHGDKFGTVGCVALDKYGNIAAGTSTGGMTNKRYGRIGDSPVIGAGTYANNNTCGVSCTGHGEFFIRYTAAHDISALMEYKNMSVEGAASEVIYKKLEPAGGYGGVICLDNLGNYAMEFNTSAMFRAYGNSKGEIIIKIFK